MRIDFAVIALSLMTGAAATAIGDRDAVQYDALGATESHDLYKRRGGGGGGGRGGGGGGSRGGGGSSSGGSRGGSGSSGGSRGGSGSSGSSGSNTRPNSNTGGTSRSGSGPQPSFGGGRYYGGGASQPFRAGASSRSGTGTGLAAGALIGAGAIAFWPGHWYHGVYPYHYRDEYEFFNHSANPPKTERLPVICGCAEGSECGCDDSGDKSNLKELIGDGSYDKLNKSLINVGNDQKGRKTIFLNGTLPNGTTTSDAAGAFGNSGLALGLWPVAAAAFAIVFTS